MKKLRIAVAGAGYIGLAHVAVAQRSPTCALSAIVDPAPAAEAVAARVGVPLYTALDELIAGDRPDGVILATPNQLHVSQALQCIAAGLPMLLEKPIAPTVAEGEKLVRAAEAAKAKILIGHHRAHSPILAKAKAIVDRGTLGRLVAVMGSAVFFKPDEYFAEGPWRRAPGGGPILINMIHEIRGSRRGAAARQRKRRSCQPARHRGYRARRQNRASCRLVPFLTRYVYLEFFGFPTTTPENLRAIATFQY